MGSSESEEFASLTLLHECLHELEASVSSSPSASSESVKTSSEGDAGLSLSGESLDDLGSSEVEFAPLESEGGSSDDSSSSLSGDSWSCASGPLSVASGVDDASQSVSSESLDDFLFVVPAHVSGGLSKSVGNASGATSVESLDDSGLSPLSSPSAPGELVDTSSVGNALLVLSKESSDNLSSLEEESALGSESPWSDASDELSSSGSHESALSSLSGE